MRNTWLSRAGVGCALLAAVLTVLVVAHWPPLISYDDRLARDLHAYAVTHRGVTHLVRVLADWVWDPWTMRAVAAVACLWLWSRGDRSRAVRVGAAVLAAAAVQQGLKALIGRARPQWPDPVATAHFAAYPSGHAMTATVVCGLLLWLLPAKAPRGAVAAARTVAAVSVLGVGFTRIYLGVHWFSDVLAGWLLGVAVVSLAAFRHACPGRSPASPRAEGPAR
ncbi:phosphatase PAP2 family protein [Streptomyces sp. W1SF4]|uniref:phosphatase PAP2 family protein n=1 Tax=Streptomyces sp. W1SF4 TaxID=2305220 RepID=UPI000F70DB6D|nr:phosphatase PAP2 family protein [Streptomyces sp. W1SF4]AZM87842.1 phosphatase PAP2 family protein [Streptomyces sp. W1SF4]